MTPQLPSKQHEALEEARGSEMRVTLPTVWGGSGFEVHEAEDIDERPEPRLRWHVMVNGVGSWPVAWFYEHGDAQLWASTMNAAFAALSTEDNNGR